MHYPVAVYDTDDNGAGRTNILALSATALGTLAMGLQPLGCCLPVVAPAVVLAIGSAGLALGVAGYRQSQMTNLSGFTPSVVGISLGICNVFMALFWCAGSSVVGMFTLIGAMS